MRRSFLAFLGAMLASAALSSAAAEDAAPVQAFSPLNGEWSGWWRPRNIFKQGKLDLTLSAEGKSVSGTMAMYEYPGLPAGLTLGNFAEGAEKRYVFVARGQNDTALNVSLQFLDDGSALYGTAELNGAVIYLRLFRQEKK